MSKMPVIDRKQRLSVLAKAPCKDVTAKWKAYSEENDVPDFEMLRSPEIGTVMVQGRAGAVGAPFNLGEITVTRCSVRSAAGTVGHGYIQGRDKAASEAAACIDALSQGEMASDIDTAITLPLLAMAEEQQRQRAGKAAGTKVEFFTMVRGDN